MESLARPPHRRKNSTTTNGVSFKNPYDDVFLSNGGKRNSFEAHEYAEIFSGSSSIPVLDLPGLDEGVGSGDFRSSKLDYSNIFGGLRNDDVAMAYEELFDGSAKKSKTPPYRTLADVRQPLQESGSLPSSGKTRLSDQSIDGVKQQFNMSFNRTGQGNIDASNGKTHVAQLHAVSGFKYVVDGNLGKKTEDDRPVPSLKSEVSRTWSFSADVEAVKGKDGLSCDKSHKVTNDKLESNFRKVPPTSSHSLDPIDKTPGRSSASNFASKEDVSKKIAGEPSPPSKKIAGEPSPPSSDEEFDENSVAALSAAALKKAIDQAQESIRIAKMIMERKKEGYQDSSKPRSGGRTKVLGKETKIDNEAYLSKEKEKYEVKAPIFTGDDGKVTPTLGHNNTLVAAGNIEVERVREVLEAAEERGQAFVKLDTLLAPNCSQSDEKVELKKVGEMSEAAETHGESTSFPGLVANNAVCKTANLKSEKVGYNNSLMLSMSKLAYHLGGLITGKEWREITVHNTKEPEVGAELLEWAPNPSEMIQKVEKSVEDDQCQVTFDLSEGPKSRVETVLSTSQRTQELEKVVDEPPENLRIIQDKEVTQRRESDVADKGKREEKFEEHEDMPDAEDLTVLRSEFDNSLNESRNLVGNEEKEEVKISKSMFEWKENCLRQGKTYAEQNVFPWFESKEKLKENDGREPDVFPKKEEVEKEVIEVYEPENDKKPNQNHAHNSDEPELARELEQNKIEERHMNTSEHDTAETTVVEGNNYEVLNSDNTLREAEVSEESNNRCEFQVAAYEEETHGTVDVNSKAEEYQKAFKNCKENNTEHEETVTFSAADEDKEPEQLFHLQDNEMPGTESLRRSASEEIFLESKLQNTFEYLFADGKTENVGIMDAEHEKKLLEEDGFKRTNEIPDAVQMYDARISGQNLPEAGPSDRTAESNLTDVRQLLERASELDEESLSTSSFENIDELSAHESQECAENTKDKNSNKEDLNNELEMVSNERKSSEEQSEGMYTQLHSEPKGMEKSMETERPVERGVNLEKTNEDLVGTSPMEEKDDKVGLRNDHQQRIEAMKREREQEKDRIAVERAIREARERAFAEARERAERAAVERATAEVRQRVIAEAREKLGKASGAKQPVDKASIEAKLRAERAAVERATAEARERALEKAMSQKTYTEGRTHSSSSRNNGLKHSFSSSDLENGMNTESAQRRKARLERHQRIMERAAKALEEKNMRDLLAQKEQAERNRLAESLDADIKRWATGKEGNLRALLSTLQYILGPDSGWQPISLTEIITTAAVRKAYRKATLYVHPDKLQQRGASIQQKYICEKIFDLLKAAWNRFNSEER